MPQGPEHPEAPSLPGQEAGPGGGGSQRRKGTGQGTVGMLLALAWLSALGKVTSFLS